MSGGETSIVSGSTTYSLMLIKKKENWVVVGHTPEEPDYVWRSKADPKSGRAFYVNQGSLGKRWALPDYSADAAILAALGGGSGSDVKQTMASTTRAAATLQPEAAAVSALGATAGPTSLSSRRSVDAASRQTSIASRHSAAPSQVSVSASAAPAAPAATPQRTATASRTQSGISGGAASAFASLPDPAATASSAAISGRNTALDVDATSSGQVSRRQSLISRQSHAPTPSSLALGTVEGLQSMLRAPSVPAPPQELEGLEPLDAVSPYEELKLALPTLQRMSESAEERERRSRLEADAEAMRREEERLEAEEAERQRVETERFFLQMEQREVQRAAERKQLIQKMEYEENMNLLRLEGMYNKRLQMEQERLQAQRERQLLLEQERNALEMMRRREIEAVAKMEQDHYDMVVREANEARERWECVRRSGAEREQSEATQRQISIERRGMEESVDVSKRMDRERKTVDRLRWELEEKEKQLLEYSLADAERERKDITYRMQLLEDLRAEQRVQKVEMERQLDALKSMNERRLDERLSAQRQAFESGQFDARDRSVEDYERHLPTATNEKVHPDGPGPSRGGSAQYDSSPSPSRVSEHIRVYGNWGEGNGGTALSPHPHPAMMDPRFSASPSPQQHHQQQQYIGTTSEEALHELMKASGAGMEEMRKELARAQRERDEAMAKYQHVNAARQWSEVNLSPARANMSSPSPAPCFYPPGIAQQPPLPQQPQYYSEYQ
eukprot:PhM_4_TR7785/c0_g1_i1/m.50083